ncbi:MAG: hypothetical protein OXB98_20000 [Bryobacterales bacterium]|nr:hypothetical protein [Bryobacterales bacterium]
MSDNGFERVLRGETTLPEFGEAVLDRHRRGEGPASDEASAARLPAEYVRHLLDSGRLNDGAVMGLARFAALLVKDGESSP